MQHLERLDHADRLAAAMAAHPSAPANAGARPRPQPRPAPGSVAHRRATDEDGSLVTEYGLLAVVAATVAGVVIQWASGGALVNLFNALLRHARSLVGA